MNKSLIGVVAGVVGSLLLLAAPAASARDHVSWSINLGVPAVGYPVYAAPVVYSQPTQIYAPVPVYVEQAPVYYAPRPVYVEPVRVYGPAYYNGYRGGYWPGHHRNHYYYYGR